MNTTPIRTAQQYRAALARIDSLMDARPGTPSGDELEVLSLLVATYENKKFPIDAPDPIDYLKAVMEFRDLEQKDLAALLNSRSRASEILNRQRPLSLAMVRLISQQWQIPAQPLIAEYPLVANH